MCENLQTSNFDYMMKENFKKRTNFHIFLVQKYIDKIIALNDPRLDLAVLKNEKEIHDKSKFEEPEYSPYLHINWKHFMENHGKKYNPSEEIQNQMNIATFHHISTNRHHPEYWYKNLTLDNLNSTDRDKPAKQVDATKMPLAYVATMVADWLAMSDERKTDPYKWAEQNIGMRWKFNKDQIINRAIT